MSASLAFETMAWGTRLDLTCSYAVDGAEYGPPREATYSMFVGTRDGGPEQVATWRSVPGRTMRLAAATAANRERHHLGGGADGGREAGPEADRVTVRLSVAAAQTDRARAAIR